MYIKTHWIIAFLYIYTMQSQYAYAYSYTDLLYACSYMVVKAQIFDQL